MSFIGTAAAVALSALVVAPAATPTEASPVLRSAPVLTATAVTAAPPAPRRPSDSCADKIAKGFGKGAVGGCIATIYTGCEGAVLGGAAGIIYGATDC